MLKDMSAHYSKSLLIVFLALVTFGLAIGGLIAFIQSYNEVTAKDRALSIRTRIGDYTSFQPIGWLPASLLRALKKWPDHSSCLSDAKAEILRWKDFGSTTEVEVCLSRAFASTATDDEIVETLQANGFTGSFAQFSNSRFTGQTSRISAVCRRSDTPCGHTLKNFWSVPFEIYAYSLSISRYGGYTLDVRVQKLTK